MLLPKSPPNDFLKCVEIALKVSTHESMQQQQKISKIHILVSFYRIESFISFVKELLVLFRLLLVAILIASDVWEMFSKLNFERSYIDTKLDHDHYWYLLDLFTYLLCFAFNREKFSLIRIITSGIVYVKWINLYINFIYSKVKQCSLK